MAALPKVSLTPALIESSCIGRYHGKEVGDLVNLIKEDEQELVFSAFNPTIAFSLGLALRELFFSYERYSSPGAGIAFTIQLFSGLTVFSGTAGEGVTADNMEWLKRKANTVRRFGVSSWARGQGRVLKGRTPDDPSLGTEYAAHGGAFPIRIKGLETGPIGVIAVSGLKQELDHEMVTTVIRAYLSSTVAEV